VKTGQFPFSANGRALGLEEPAGFAKVVADAATDRVLGVHVIHARASDVIQEGVTTMEFAGASEDIARIVHGHPTLAEVVKEAALAVDKRSLNM
jgi:dihydrolipoamide dehydrogenase